ncbi:Acetylglutamate kinase [Hondaea fermentalgiana]|uniref:amino-acid N-acetyltransferase n=1 Tax=Hondaea fermentalgiana TaxID=2315210 RepID=A0A2R5GJY6_9STRA|nr:Acetylglutamate kinase [Hondaea fermentalgiana]|eukprot:GBG28174.1 Acetylglutamate kinase [Hondaea fermentalgiana]
MARQGKARQSDEDEDENKAREDEDIEGDIEVDVEVDIEVGVEVGVACEGACEGDTAVCSARADASRPTSRPASASHADTMNLERPAMRRMLTADFFKSGAPAAPHNVQQHISMDDHSANLEIEQQSPDQQAQNNASADQGGKNDHSDGSGHSDHDLGFKAFGEPSSDARNAKVAADADAAQGKKPAMHPGQSYGQSFQSSFQHKTRAEAAAAAMAAGGNYDVDEEEEDAQHYDKRAELFQTDNLQVLPGMGESDRAKNERLTGYQVFRSMAPYIAVHFQSIVVIHVPGEVLESGMAEQVMHDIILLKTLGIRPVLVAGCRPQIRRKLDQVGKKSLFVQGNRVCDTETLYHCQSVAGHVRLYIESLLTRGLMNSPTGVGSVQVTSGNFVRAIAFGVRGGIDFLHTGIVKKVAADRIRKLLDEGDVVVLSHLGVSQSGTIYHCRSEDVAVQAAIDLRANKLVFLHNGEGLVDMRKRGGAIVHNLPLNVADSFSTRLARELGQDGQDYVSHSSDVDPKTQWKLQFLDYMQGAIRAVRNGVHRAHLVSRHIEGSIISELCTRDGVGLLISTNLYDGVRGATVHDVPAIKGLIAPLEQAGILITRPPKMIEKDVDNFIVFERDGVILACCHLKHYPDPRYGRGAVEMSCVAVSKALHGAGIGNSLLSYCLRRALSLNINNLFVLTTQTQGWFIDRGFQEVSPDHLPPGKLKTYDYSRASKVFIKTVNSAREIDEEEIIWFKHKSA